MSVSPELESCRAASLRPAVSYRAALHDDATHKYVGLRNNTCSRDAAQGSRLRSRQTARKNEWAKQTHSLTLSLTHSPTPTLHAHQSLDSSSRTRSSPFPSLHEICMNPMQLLSTVASQATERERERREKKKHSWPHIRLRPASLPPPRIRM
ncbi:hypothetical protein CI102_8695 [Trichoderma harzianum]|nr:hypothetical protein CI102_8695 [Trichoderma harzianum]